MEKNNIMTTEQFIKAAIEHDEAHKDHNDFYDLAERFGFCTPWCKCGECS
jgi:hypothetical protein